MEKNNTEIKKLLIAWIQKLRKLKNTTIDESQPIYLDDYTSIDIEYDSVATQIDTLGDCIVELKQVYKRTDEKKH